MTSKGAKCPYISSFNSIVQPSLNMIMCNTTGLDLFGVAGTQQKNSSGSWKAGAKSPIADVRIRNALALAISTEGYLKGIDQNVGRVATGIYSTASKGYKSPGYPVGGTATAIKAGKALVAAYKASNSLKSSAAITIHMQTVNTTLATSQFQYFAKAAKAIGITLVQVPLVQSVLINNAIFRYYEMSSWAQFGGLVQDGNYVWWDSSKTNTGNAPGFLPGPPAAGGVNFANNIDPQVETSMLSALADTTQAAQLSDWQTVNSRFAKDFPYLWVDETIVVWAANSTVQNWANPMAPSTSSTHSTTSVLSPDGGTLEWAQVWIS